ncbi:hypothetical protein N9B63_05090 [Akkermansiaceae bacterium]|nr:hypothetical protein [Akkermansiaceae bacterium]MDB4465696.1 hypothetical protein [Akkermansiaceae bacterium]
MSRRDLVFALLIAAWAHIGLFFIFVVLMASNLFSARIDYDKKEPRPEPSPIRMQMVYEEPVGAPAVPVEPVLPDEVEEEKQPPAFVQTNESQESEEPPEEMDLIGERDTTATSDERAVAGAEDMAALSGEEEKKSDPKTFDSDFAEGDAVGGNTGMKDAVDVGKGDDQINQEVAKTTGDAEPLVRDPAPEPIEDMTPPLPKDDLTSIEDALAMLEEEVGDGLKKEQIKPGTEKVEETMPERPTRDQREAAEQDGGFAPRSRKTRVAGVISANGKGSLDVANTAIGRYQGAIFKKLETAWQMENIRNRSLLAPGNVTLYFVVNKDGKVSRQKQMAMVGASGTQWGMILRSLSVINIPKMPKDVVKELEGDPLEIIVTFNYH